MPKQVHVSRTRYPFPAEEVFGWHERPGAFERLQPPWEDVRVASRTGGIQDGSEVHLDVAVGPLTQRWIMRHEGYQAGVQFQDRMVQGPFAHWLHTHRVEPVDAESCELVDHIEFAFPGGMLGSLAGSPFVRPKLERTFRYRHDALGEDLRARAALPPRRIRVGVTGSGGLVGSALVPYLTTSGHEVVRLVREAADAEGETVAHDHAVWTPGTGELAGGGAVDAVVHLAGEPIASERWTPEKRRRIRDSRVEPTRRLCETLAASDAPPETLVCASAVGIYGDRGDEELTEDATTGEGFLADVGREWEDATEPARAAGIRVVHLRLGIVLSMAGGALAKMLTPFRLGVGGRLGSGEQWMSWISLDDVLGLVEYALLVDSLRGPVNAVAPQPLTNADFTRTLGRVLSRPTLAPAPAFALRAALGEMADHLLLSSQRVLPRRAPAAGYAFRRDELEPALRHLLGRQR